MGLRDILNKEFNFVNRFSDKHLNGFGTQKVDGKTGLAALGSLALASGCTNTINLAGASMHPTTGGDERGEGMAEVNYHGSYGDPKHPFSLYLRSKAMSDGEESRVLGFADLGYGIGFFPLTEDTINVDGQARRYTEDWVRIGPTLRVMYDSDQDHSNPSGELPVTSGGLRAEARFADIGSVEVSATANFQDNAAGEFRGGFYLAPLDIGTHYRCGATGEIRFGPREEVNPNMNRSWQGYLHPAVFVDKGDISFVVGPIGKILGDEVDLGFGARIEYSN